MKRTLYDEAHERFRVRFQEFVEREVVPEYPCWEREGGIPRALWRKAGAAGFLCPWLPPAFGGKGADFLHSTVMMEVIAENQVPGFFLTVHNDIIVPYLWSYGNDEQKRHWLPKCCSGEYITAIAMTEPDAGSDLQAIQTTARRHGDHYVVNGRKTFISNGWSHDLCVVAVKTDPHLQPPYRGISLLVVEDGTPGYEKGRKLAKIGLRAQDTAELFFQDCRIPVANRLGREGEGFAMLMEKLPRERLVIAIWAAALMRAALAQTRKRVAEQKDPKTLFAEQDLRFKWAEMSTTAELAQVFLDRVITAHLAGEPIHTESAMAKFWIAEQLVRLTSQCLEIFGPAGCLENAPLARLFRDARVYTIFAGTTEIMKEIIARNLLDRQNN